MSGYTVTQVTRTFSLYIENKNMDIWNKVSLYKNSSVTL